jgi:hypothetical protein
MHLVRMVIAGRAAALVAFFCVVPILVGFCLPLIGRSLPFVNSASLFGYTEKSAPARFSWWDRSLQLTLSLAIDEHLPLRNWMIRINNQLDYWILRTSRMFRGRIVVGREGALFDRHFISQTFGYAPAMPDDAIRSVGGKIKQLHRLLAARGIPLVVIATPGKVSFMPNSVPTAFPNYHQDTPRNFDRLLKIFGEVDVPFFDCRAEMRQSPEASRAPLFPRGGTHWTMFGAYVALERPVNQLLQEFNRSDSARLVLDDVSLTQIATGTDSDLLDLMNLLAPDRSYGTVQLRAHVVGSPLPKAVIFVGSSFGAQIQSFLLQAGVARRVLRFEYMETLMPCPKCGFEKVPPTWPQIVLDDASAVILELNEGAFFGSHYIEEFFDGLVPVLQTTAVSAASTHTWPQP